jgi:hypothetical protein
MSKKPKKIMTLQEFDEEWRKMKITSLELRFPDGETVTYSADDYEWEIGKEYILVWNNDMSELTQYFNVGNIITVRHYRAPEAETA